MRLKSLGLVLIVTMCAAQNSRDWVARSNENARILLNVQAKFFPEYAASTGVEGLDEQIFDLTPGYAERLRKALRAASNELEQKLKAEKDPLVRQDLEILLDAADEQIQSSELNEKYLIPYFNVTRTVFGSLRALLDDQIAPGRRKAALVRLRKYAGSEPGTTPLTILAEQRIRERLAVKSLLGPPKIQLDKDLENTASFMDGLGPLFEKYKIEGYQEPLSRLKAQIAAYNAFLNKEVAPRARADFRLPQPLYKLAFRNYGVDIEPGELVRIAHAAYDDLQKQMDVIARQIAKEHGMPQPDYRSVIRVLKQKQLVGDAILPHYLDRLKQMEAIIRREDLVTLPSRAARIRLASTAETAAQPAPHMRPPRLINNTGEQGEFVLPLNIAGEKGKTLQYDDFTFEAASWTLTAHEVRPGHEMQFAAMTERGVSNARAIFAFNSVNVEGWGLYSEAIMRPFMPLEGQLISLQHRLLRAARAFLDPELQMGKIQPREAMRILQEDVLVSEAMATQEVERYTFRSPGQAVSYFYGYTKLMQLRQDAEKALGRSFQARAFHDFVLSQGLLPPALMRKAVMETFVPQLRSAGAAPKRKDTALDRYIAKPDPSFKYSLAGTIPGDQVTAYVLDMTSQQWRKPSEVDRTEWKHWVTLFVPKEVRSSTGFLFITGGANGRPFNKTQDPMLSKIAADTGTVVTELRMVPNQPLVFAGEAAGRVEDSLIAYGWDKFLRGGDEEWLARLPMTKSAVRAMDAATAFLATAEGGRVKLDKFVVSGASKRGWTTWTTAAVDRRVVAIAPLVIDLLNVERSFEHHWRVYGFWAPAIKDYVDLKIVDWTGTPEYRRLLDIEDPYSYRDRYTLPKYIVNSAGDQFFLPDSSQFYFDDLPGEKYLRYVPNTDHGLRNSDVAQSLTAFYDAILHDRPRPRFTWKFENDGSIRVRTAQGEPSAVKLWQVTNPAARDFRLEKIGPAWKESPLQPVSGGEYVARIEKPASGFSAFFVELTYPSGGKYPFKFTTAVRVTPDTLPHPPFQGKKPVTE